MLCPTPRATSSSATACAIHGSPPSSAPAASPPTSTPMHMGVVVTPHSARQRKGVLRDILPAGRSYHRPPLHGGGGRMEGTPFLHQTLRPCSQLLTVMLSLCLGANLISTAKPTYPLSLFISLALNFIITLLRFSQEDEKCPMERRP